MATGPDDAGPEAPMDQNDAAAAAAADRRLQQFYDDESKDVEVVAGGDQDEDALFAELYGDKAAADSTNPPAAPPEDAEAKGDDDGDESDDEESDDESGEESDQDVKIILMNSGEAGRPSAVRPAPNRYVRHPDAEPVVPAPSAATSTVPIADAVDSAASAPPIKTKSGLRGIGDMIPEQPVPVDANGQRITFPSVYDVDIDALPEKPWKNPMADPSDWFNYGFDEDSWRAYCQRQVQMRLTLTKAKRQRGQPAPDMGGGLQPGPPILHHHGRRGPPSVASVPPPHRPPQPISQDVLELGGGSKFGGEARPPRHVNGPGRGREDPYHQRGPPPQSMPPDAASARFKGPEAPVDPRARSGSRHDRSPRRDSMTRSRDDHRDRYERRSVEQRDLPAAAAPRRPRSPPRPAYDKYERRDYRDKRGRSPVPTREYDAKRRRADDRK